MYLDTKGNILRKSIKSLIEDNEERLMWSEASDEWLERDRKALLPYRRLYCDFRPIGYVPVNQRDKIQLENEMLRDYLLFIDDNETYELHYTQLHKFGLHKYYH